MVSCSTIAKSPYTASALANAARALTISDAEVIALTNQFIAQSDASNSIAAPGSSYAQRLKRLTDPYAGGRMNLNFKVYMAPDVNAFATANGSVRVYSGLMDIMDEDELLGVIGHEIGHVANNDVKDAMRNAYLTVAEMEAVSAIGGSTVANIAHSQIGQLGQAFLSSHYSRRQENEADDYGLEFLEVNGYNPLAMATALDKINALSGGGGNAIAVAFSSHPDSAGRARRVRQAAEAYLKAHPAAGSSSSSGQGAVTSPQWSF